MVVTVNGGYNGQRFWVVVDDGDVQDFKGMRLGVYNLHFAP